MTRVLKSWSKHNLPEELWHEILSRVPVKSLLRFRCVSKSWQSVIDDPDFCRLHLSHLKKNRHQTHLFVVEGDYSEEYRIRCSNTFKTTARLASIRQYFGYLKNFLYLCSIDGMVMLTFTGDGLPSTSPGLMLWNPSIKKCRSLPPMPKIFNQVVCTDLGLGFDPLIKDYKHVRIIKGGDYLHLIAIFTIGTGSWKTIPFQGKGCSSWPWLFGFRKKTICFRGYLCFLDFIRGSNPAVEELVAFDLSNEVFSGNSLPADHDVDCSRVQHELVMVDGRCSLVKHSCSKAKGSVWVLESSGTNFEFMHWNKLYSFTTDIADFLCLKKNGDFLFLNEKGKVMRYDAETHEKKLLLKSMRLTVTLIVSDYIESLLLLK